MGLLEEPEKPPFSNTFLYLNSNTVCLGQLGHFFPGFGFSGYFFPDLLGNPGKHDWYPFLLLILA